MIFSFLLIPKLLLIRHRKLMYTESHCLYTPLYTYCVFCTYLCIPTAYSVRTSVYLLRTLYVPLYTYCVLCTYLCIRIEYFVYMKVFQWTLYPGIYLRSDWAASHNSGCARQWFDWWVLLSLPPVARKDHSPEDDHSDTITALTACKKMRLFASASLDGTVKIWSDTNKLVRYVHERTTPCLCCPCLLDWFIFAVTRHLKLNATPHCLEFVDSRGTLLVGIGKNIHRIEPTECEYSGVISPVTV